MSKRTERLAQQLRSEISQLIQRGELKDPRIGFLTITGVRVGKNLDSARIYVSVYGTPEEGEQTIQALQRAQGFIRRQLGKLLRLRQIPEMTFLLDNSIEEGIRVNRLIDSLPEFQSEDDQTDNDEHADDGSEDATASQTTHPTPTAEDHTTPEK